jgi:hypothetical protein
MGGKGNKKTNPQDWHDAEYKKCIQGTKTPPTYGKSGNMSFQKDHPINPTNNKQKPN